MTKKKLLSFHNNIVNCFFFQRDGFKPKLKDCPVFFIQKFYFEICFYSSLSGDGAKLFTGTCGRKNAVSFDSLSPMSASDFHWQECEGGANDREGKSRVLFLPGFLV